MPRKFEHRDVAVGVAGGEQWSAAGASPDADRLLPAIVKVVGFGPADDRAAALIGHVLERGRAADHALTRDSVDLVADRAHEVTPAAGRDVVREAVGLEVGEQLDHRHVRAFQIRAAERRMLGCVQERLRLRLKVVDGAPAERRVRPVPRSVPASVPGAAGSCKRCAGDAASSQPRPRRAPPPAPPGPPPRPPRPPQRVHLAWRSSRPVRAHLEGQPSPPGNLDRRASARSRATRRGIGGSPARQPAWRRRSQPLCPRRRARPSAGQWSGRRVGAG
jgi:hypothetical protein